MKNFKANRQFLSNTFSNFNTKFNKFSNFGFSKEIKIKLSSRQLASTDLDNTHFPTETTTNKEELIRYYKTMTLWRKVEFESDNLYKNKEIRGFCHLYIGQEAVALGMDEGLTKKDCLITAYREHCQAMSRGHDPKSVIAEMMSRSTGSTKGKGGSMHYYSKKQNFYGGHGIVGAQIPMGTGLAFGIKYSGNKENCCFTLFGDGSVNQGQFLEASNMAGLMKLPVVYVIENNKYAMGTAEARHSHHLPIYSKFRSFPGISVDGQCVFTMREFTKFCKSYVIKNGPMLMEVDTYRYQGHSMSDPGVSYRTKEEITQFRNTLDCIMKVKNIILEHSLLTEKELKEIDNKIKDELEVIIEQCHKDPYPHESELFTELYINQEKMFIRGTELSNSYHLDLLEGK